MSQSGARRVAREVEVSAFVSVSVSVFARVVAWLAILSPLSRGLALLPSASLKLSVQLNSAQKLKRLGPDDGTCTTLHSPEDDAHLNGQLLSRQISSRLVSSTFGHCLTSYVHHPSRQRVYVMT